MKTAMTAPIILPRTALNAVIQHGMSLVLTVLMTIAAQSLGLVMVLKTAKIRLMAVTSHVMIMMVVTAQKHVKIIHVGMVPAWMTCPIVRMNQKFQTQKVSVSLVKIMLDILL